MALLFTISSGLFAWIALTSAVHFLLAMAGAANAVTSIGAMALAALVVWRLMPRGVGPLADTAVDVRWAWVLGIVFVLAEVLVLAAAWSSTAAQPHGDWDAWSIWNLRARMIAGGEWRHAVSPQFSNHPDYPLLTSSFIANVWTLLSSRATMVPQVLGWLFYVGSAAVMASGVALLRGRASGWLAGLLLAGSAGYFVQAPLQYADVPLSLYFLLAFVWLALDQPVAAGFFAACAAWTKNEGLAFAVVFLIAASFAVNRLRLWLGAAPMLAFVAVFKGFVAASTGGSVSVVAANLADGGRLAKIAGSFVSEFAQMGGVDSGMGWRHPLLLLVVLAAALGVRRSRTGIVLAAVLGAQIAIYFGIYVFTKEDLDWLLSTSLSRVVAQIWPCLIFTAFLWLNPLVSSATGAQAEPVREPKAPRRGKGSVK